MLKALLLLLQVTQQYLVMGPVQAAIQDGRFAALAPICRPSVVVSLEEPLAIRGALGREQFIDEFSSRFSALEVEKLEWSSIQVEEDNAVQSLNLIMKRRFSGSRVFYKLILFMNRDASPPKGKEWKLYYLRGLKM
ncbi:MAG: hypothetical protein MUF02_04345 [Acidobacteria bacterium]|jgi:hypothetical protein|nr:hypothetical protein [Acidobacteriota bacterium]